MQISCCVFGDSKSCFTFFLGVGPKNLDFKQTQGGDCGGRVKGQGSPRNIRNLKTKITCPRWRWPLPWRAGKS